MLYLVYLIHQAHYAKNSILTSTWGLNQPERYALLSVLLYLIVVGSVPVIFFPFMLKGYTEL